MTHADTEREDDRVLAAVLRTFLPDPDAYVSVGSRYSRNDFTIDATLTVSDEARDVLERLSLSQGAGQ